MLNRDHLLDLLVSYGYSREEMELKIEKKEDLQQLLLEILTQGQKEKEKMRSSKFGLRREREEEADEIDYKLLYEECKQFLNELISSTQSQLKLRRGGH